MKLWLIFGMIFISLQASAQILRLKNRKDDALTGSAFAASINDTSLTLKKREQLIYQQIKQGNVPDFYRHLVGVRDTLKTESLTYTISYFVAPDYLAIGTDSNYFYTPLTPRMAQRVANKLKCSLPTRKMVNQIYQQALVKLSPQPIPPTPAMSTVPVFIKHNEIVSRQRDSVLNRHHLGELTAGNKKDIIISPRIYNDTSNYHVVIYGWHRLNGKAIQPLYAKHLKSWADYSHGVRLVQQNVWVNSKRIRVNKVLRNKVLNQLLSDEGQIRKPYYP